VSRARLIEPGFQPGENREARLSPEAAQHARVLRLRVGDSLSLCDGAGSEWLAEVMALGRDLVVRVGDALPAPIPDRAPLEITLLQGLPKAEHADFVLQKATELGVSRLVFVATARAVPRVDAAAPRWERIVREAARQCGRRELPALSFAPSLEAGLAQATGDLRLFCAEAGGDGRLRDQLPERARAVTLAIGPEGGFAPEEVERARAAGFCPVWLGERVLRTETAALAAIAIVQHLYGDLG
jgi:16S rRNA (uracil1498-N3)-methyltransferase